MARPRMLALVAAAAASCTLDSTNPTGTGSGGAPTTTSGATQPTTGATMSTASTSSAASMSSGSTTSSSAADSASSSDASSSASSSSGGATDVPFCMNVHDDFESYTEDFNLATLTDFFDAGELGGPWAEATNLNPDNVTWLNDGMGKHIRTRMEGGTRSILYLKSKYAVTSPCVVTVRLLRITDHIASFGLVNDGPNPVNNARIECDESGGRCGSLEAFGFNGPQQINVPVNLAVLVKGMNVFGFYDNGGGWTLISGPPPQGQTSATLLGGQLTVFFGQVEGDAESDWDNFNVPTFPLALMP